MSSCDNFHGIENFQFRSFKYDGDLDMSCTTTKMLINRSLPVAFVYDPMLLVVSSSAGYKERYWYQLAAALVT